MLGSDINSGYYASNAPLDEKIARGLETGLFMGTSPGMLPAVGTGLKGLNQVSKNIANTPKLSLAFQSPAERLVNPEAYKVLTGRSSGIRGNILEGYYNLKQKNILKAQNKLNNKVFDARRSNQDDLAESFIEKRDVLNNDYDKIQKTINDWRLKYSGLPITPTNMGGGQGSIFKNNLNQNELIKVGSYFGNEQSLNNLVELGKTYNNPNVAAAFPTKAIPFTKTVESNGLVGQNINAAQFMPKLDYNSGLYSASEIMTPEQIKFHLNNLNELGLGIDYTGSAGNIGRVGDKLGLVDLTYVGPAGKRTTNYFDREGLFNPTFRNQEVLGRFKYDIDDWSKASQPQQLATGALDPVYPETALLPANLPIKATSTLGKIGVGLLETAVDNPGFGLGSMIKNSSAKKILKAQKDKILKVAKDAKTAVDEFVVTPIQFRKEIAELKQLKNDYSSIFNTEEGKKRLGLLGIDPSKISDYNLKFKPSAGSYYATGFDDFINEMNIDFRQVQQLKKKGYMLSPKSIFEHEMGHLLQKESYKQKGILKDLDIYNKDLIEHDKIRDRILNNPYLTSIQKSLKLQIHKANAPVKPFITTKPTLIDKGAKQLTRNNSVIDDQKIAASNLLGSNILSFPEKSYSYFNHGSDVERFAHLREMRQNMIESGVIKNMYDPITNEDLLKFVTNNPGDRVSSFVDASPNNIEWLKTLLNSMPAAVPAVGIGVGIGVGALQQDSQPQQQAQGGYINPYMYYSGGPMEYGRGGNFLKHLGAGAYSVGEGILDTVTGGATDQLTDKGFEYLTKVGNKNMDLSDPRTAKFHNTQQQIKGYGNTTAAVATGIATGNVQGAIQQGAKGLNTAFQASDWATDDFKKWSGISSQAIGIGAGLAGGSLNTTGTSASASEAAGKVGEISGKVSPYVNQAVGMFGSNQQPMWQQAQAQQDYLNSPEYAAQQSLNNQQYVNQGLSFARGGTMDPPDGGLGFIQPTRADSIAVLNNSLAVRAHYDRLQQKGLYDKPVISTEYKSGQQIYDYYKPGSSENKALQSTLQTLPRMNDYIKEYGRHHNLNPSKLTALLKTAYKTANIQDPNKAYLYDYYPYKVDITAPATIIDRRISPQYLIEYYSTKGNDIPGGAITGLPAYDPLAVTPWDMLREDQKKERVEKFGKDGKPIDPSTSPPPRNVRPNINKLQSKQSSENFDSMGIVGSPQQLPPTAPMSADSEGHYRTYKIHTHGEPIYQVWEPGKPWRDVSNEEFEKISSEKYLTEYRSTGGNITNNSLNLQSMKGRYQNYKQRMSKGGTFNQYGIDMIPDSAGLHHQSAYGGVPIGPDALAEGGEIKMDTPDGGQYIVSDQVDGTESQMDFTFSKGGKYKELNRTLAEGMKQDLSKYSMGSLATNSSSKEDVRRPMDSYSTSTIDQIKQKWRQKTEFARQRSQQEQAIAQAEEQKRLIEEEYIAAYGGKINPKKYPGLNRSKKSKGGYVYNAMTQPMLAHGGPVVSNIQQPFNGPAAQNRGGMMMADGGMMQQQGGQDQMMELIQAYAQVMGIPPEEILQQLQQMDPKSQEKAMQQMAEELQGSQQQSMQQQMPPQQNMMAIGGTMPGPDMEKLMNFTPDSSYLGEDILEENNLPFDYRMREPDLESIKPRTYPDTRQKIVGSQEPMPGLSEDSTFISPYQKYLAENNPKILDKLNYDNSGEYTGYINPYGKGDKNSKNLGSTTPWYEEPAYSKAARYLPLLTSAAGIATGLKNKKRTLAPERVNAQRIDLERSRITSMEEGRRALDSGLRDGTLGSNPGQIAGNTKDMILNYMKNMGANIAKSYETEENTNAQLAQQAGLANQQAGNQFKIGNEEMFQNAQTMALRAAQEGAVLTQGAAEQERKQYLQEWIAKNRLNTRSYKTNINGKDVYISPDGKMYDEQGNPIIQ